MLFDEDLGFVKFRLVDVQWVGEQETRLSFALRPQGELQIAADGRLGVATGTTVRSLALLASPQNHGIH